MRIAIVVAGVALLAGCASEGPVATIATPSNTSGFEGTYVDPPLPKPDVTLTDTDGKPFNIAKDTAGKVTALYFGYTHCPDVCPTTMADLSVALGQLPQDVAKQVDVVFVTTDPQRDTPKKIAKWLDSFTAKDLVGLSGPMAKIQKAAETDGIFIDPPVKNDDGTVTVEHGAQVIVFNKQGEGELIFSSGFEPDEVAHDLQKLVEEQ